MKKPINEIKKMQLIAGLITESEYQEAMMNDLGEDGELTKTGEEILSQEKRPYWDDNNINTIDTKLLTTYTKGDYNIEVIENQFYFENDKNNIINYNTTVKIFRDKKLIKRKIFYGGAKWKGMSVEDLIDYTIQQS